MARSNYRYTQSVIGDCGHLCDGWPLLSSVGGGDPHVICDVCTREQHGIPESERVGIWVRVVDKPEKKKAAPKAKAVPKKNKAAAFWEQFML